MKWVLEEAQSGDIVRVRLGEIYHYGIFVSESEVIQFGMPPVNVEMLARVDVRVCSTDIDTFRCGKFPEVAKLSLIERLKRFSPEKTVATARARLGECGYNIIHNNCEHFVYECVFGTKYSAQTEDVRQKFRNLPITDIYVSPIPEHVKITGLSCEGRNAEIEACSNIKVKEQKYYVWKLLEAALQYSLGLDAGKITFRRSENGKWGCKECEFSLSHSQGAAAVIISRSPAGIDLEKIKHTEKTARYAQKVLTVTENEIFSALSEEDKDDLFYGFWSAKESIFKQSGERSFNPVAIEVSSYMGVKSGIVRIEGEDYALSFVSDTKAKERFYIYNGGQTTAFNGFTRTLKLDK